MARKTPTKTASRSEPERGLFPDVAPVRRAKKPASAANRRPAVERVERIVDESAESAAAPTATPTATQTRDGRPASRSIVATVGALALVGLAAGGLALHFLGSDSDATATIKSTARNTSPEASAPVVLSGPVEAASATPSDTTAPARSGVAVPASTLAPAAHASAPQAEDMGAELHDLVAATQKRDDDAIEAAKESLERLADENPAAAVAAVLAALRGEKDELNLAVLSSVLLNESLADRPEVLAALADMAQKDELPARRATAVRTLGNLPGADSSRVEMLSGMEHADADPSVREAAAVALGFVGDHSPGDVAAAAAKTLVDAVGSESDPRVRSMLLYAVRDTRTPAVTEVLLDALAHDQDAAPRLAAADMLGDVAAASRPRVVEALAAQLGPDTDPRLGATVVKSIVGAGRLSAIPVLQRVRGGLTGSLQTTIDDYLAGLNSGEDGMEKLEAIKLARETARAR